MASSTERIGVNHCGEIAERNNWMFREQPVNDVGIDAHMEYYDYSREQVHLIALQIKSGESWFKEKKDGCVIFRDIDERQYHYWTANPLPCILVLYNPKDDTCIWQELTTETIERTLQGKGKGFFVRVPLTQVFLSDSSNDKLRSITALPEYIINYNFLLSQEVFMQIINDGGEVRLHSTEWVNKSSGRGEIELIVDDGISTKTYSYPYWFPFKSYTDVFPKLFPWADFSADEDYYEEDDESSWREYHCYYDKEDNEWLIVGDTFEEYRRKLNPMRSINHSDEVAEYMLLLSINELGRSFLAVNEFVSQDQTYSNTRPKEE